MKSEDNPHAGRELEARIAACFDHMADSGMFPREMAADDFELEAVLDGLGDVRGLRILDVGCAKGRFLQALGRRGARMVGVDPAWNLLREAAGQGAPGLPRVQSSATTLPFAPSSFDGLICVEVVEHIPGIDDALAEFARVLKPGGRAVIIDKNPYGIGYVRLTPNWIHKKRLDREGGGSYPRGFPFQERWHSASALRRKLQRHFGEATVRYLDGRVRGRRRLLLGPLYRLLPYSRPDLAWVATRRTDVSSR